MKKKLKIKSLCCFFVFFLIYLWFINLNLGNASVPNLYPDINAICAVAIDGSTGKILFAKNPHLKIPPASTVKLVTAMVVLDHLSLSQEVRISKNASQTPNVSPKLYEGEIYTVKDLLYLMLMKSSNQAAVALAEAVAGSEENFSLLMNKKAFSLGLTNSHFVTASGLPAPNQYTTPYELAITFYEALKYPIIKEIINTPVKIITSETGRTLVIKNTNELLSDPELEGDIIGGKTGFTRASKHCLVNGVYIKDRLIITSILGSPNREMLWQDSKTLIAFAKLVLTNQVSPLFINTVVNTAMYTEGVLHKKGKTSYKNSSRKFAKKPKMKYYGKKSKKTYLSKNRKSKKLVKKSKKPSMAKTLRSNKGIKS